MQGLSGGFFNKPVVRADRREPDNGRKRGITMAERKQITTKEYLAEVKGGLENELNLNAKALPENFNQSRFVLNCISLIKSNLSNYNNITPESVYLALAKGAYLGLDFFNGECYAIPYSGEVNFQTDYKGEIKLAKTYSRNPIKDIYAKNVREGDFFEEIIESGKQSVNFRPVPFSDKKIIGTFAVVQPTGGPLYAFAWARTDAFDIEEPKNSLIVGVDIRFDILEYPNQETTDPDPVIGTNRFIKEMYLDSIVVGYDKMNDITEASKEVPVIYCRLLTSDLAEQTNTVAWMDGRLAVHILCPDGVVRRKMAMAIAQKLSLAGEVILLDKSPMFIRRLQIDNKSDYLKDGQVFITGRYGLLRYKAKPYSLNNTSINYS